MVSLFAGLTSQTIDVFIQDSSSTTGGGLTGLLFNTASLVAYYRKGPTATATAITLATQTVGGAYSSGGFVEIDATNMPGVYRLDVPNAMIDTSVMVSLILKGAANMAPTLVRVDCRALPANTLQVNGTSQTAGDLTALITTVDNVVDAIEVDTQDIQSRIPAALVSGRISSVVGAFAIGVIDAAAIASNAFTAAKFAASALDDKGNWLKPTVAGRTLDVTTGGCSGLDWANVEAPTTSLALTGTTISTSQVIATVTNQLAASVIADAIWDEDLTGHSTSDTAGAVVTSISTTVGTISTNVTTLLGRITATLFSGITSLAQWLGLMAGKQTADATALAEIKATGAGSGTYASTTDSLEAQADAGGGSLTVADIVDGVWDEALSGHNTSGTTGAALAAAQSAGDPWATALPGAYSAGTAGYIVGTDLSGAIDDIANIEAAIGDAAIVKSPVIRAGLISVIEGITYDGTLLPKIYWTTTTDYTGADSITMTIWRVEEDETRTIMKTVTGSAPTTTRVEIPDFTATFLADLVFAGKPMQETLQFAVVAVEGSDKYAIDSGDFIVRERREA